MKNEVYRSGFLTPRFSKIALLIFALVFAGVGTYIVLSSRAATNFVTTPTTVTGLGTPKITAPFDGNILISKRPVLSWNAVSGANAYRVKIYQGDNLVIDDLARTNTYSPYFDLTDKANYYWSVQALSATIAYNEQATANLAARRTTIVPATPIQVSPANGTHVTANTVAATWKPAVTGAAPFTYIAEYTGAVTLSTDGSYTNPWYKTSPLSTTSTTFSQLTPNVYFWHVKTMDSAGKSSPWSPSWTYTVDQVTTPTTPTPPPVVTPAPTDTTVTISNRSVATFFHNFSIDTSRTTNFLLPDPATKWVGAYVPTVTSAAADFASLEALAGKKLHIANKFKSFYWDKNFPTTEAQNYYNTGHHYLLTWEPWKSGAATTSVEWTQFSNNAIATNKAFVNSSGVTVTYDEYLTTWAQQMKTYGKPVYLRFAHEMNGNWYPWGNANGNTPASYIAMWQHVHDVFEANGVKNVRWVWCANIDPSNTIKSYYPGDAYVDVIAFDGYNWGTTKTWSSWQEFSNIFGTSYGIMAPSYSRDIWITETASSETGGAKASWITNAFTAATNSFPRVRAIVWFNQQKESDWRVESTSTSLSAFKSAILKY